MQNRLKMESRESILAEPYTDWREMPIPVPEGLEPILAKATPRTISSKAYKRWDFSDFNYRFRFAALSLTVLFGAPVIPVLVILVSFSLLESILIRLNQLILDVCRQLL